MTEHHIKLNWEKGTSHFTYDAYPRNNAISFKNGQETVAVSSAPTYRGDATKPDPEDFLWQHFLPVTC
jgi:hypothetical protein